MQSKRSKNILMYTLLGRISKLSLPAELKFDENDILTIVLKCFKYIDKKAFF